MLRNRAFLDAHFETEEEAAEATADAVESAELAHPLGETVGPIDANGSLYFLYLPKSLKQGRNAPLLFFTCSGGGDAGRLNSMIEGAELCGWIIAISQESKNGMSKEDSVVHSKNSLTSLTESSFQSHTAYGQASDYLPVGLFCGSPSIRTKGIDG